MYDHNFDVLGLSSEAKPEEVGPAYLARAKELARLIKNGDLGSVSRVIEKLHELHEAYPKALEASERLVQLMANHNVLVSPDSPREYRILAGIMFVSGADERHLKMLEDILPSDLPDQLKKEASVKIHAFEDRSSYTQRGDIILLQYGPSLDKESYSNLSDKTLEIMAKAPFVPENIREFAGSRVICRILAAWRYGEITPVEAAVRLQAIAIPANGYSEKVKAAAPDLARIVGSANVSSPDAPRWRPTGRTSAHETQQVTLKPGQK